MPNKPNGGEGCDGKDLVDAIEQVHAVNKLAAKEKISPYQRYRTHNKIRDGLGDEMQHNDERKWER